MSDQGGNDVDISACKYKGWLLKKREVNVQKAEGRRAELAETKDSSKTLLDGGSR